MNDFPDEQQLHELRRLWHALLGFMRGTKADVQFSAIHNLSPVETGIIDIVAENTDVIIGDIGKSLNLPKSTLTSIIDRLEKRDYVRRIISPRDRRSYGLELTESGMAVYAEHVRFETLAWRKILAVLDGTEDGRNLLLILRKIVNGIAKDNSI